MTLCQTEKTGGRPWTWPHLWEATKFQLGYNKWIGYSLSSWAASNSVIILDVWGGSAGRIEHWEDACSALWGLQSPVPSLGGHTMPSYRFFLVGRWINVSKIALGGLKCLIALSALGSGGSVVTSWRRNGKWSGSLKPVIYVTSASLAPGEGSEVRLQLNWKETQKRDVLLWICWPGSREISGNYIRPHRICHQVLLIWVISQEEYIVLAK